MPLLRILSSVPFAITGVGLAVAYWLAESAVGAFAFSKGGFVEQLLPGEASDLWSRAVTSALLIGWGLGAQMISGRRRRKEQRMLMLSSAVEQSVEGLAVVDLEGNIQYVNETFAAMHGYTPKALAGGHLSMFHTPEQMPAADAAIAEIRRTGEFRGEVWHARRDGSVFLAAMHNTLLRDASGTPVYMLGTLRDITEHKRVEEAVRRGREELERQVHERTAEIQRANEALRQEIAERARAEEELNHHRANLEELVTQRTEELTRTETKYQTLFDTAAMPIAIWARCGSEWRLELLNAECAKSLSATRNELVGKNLTEAIPHKKSHEDAVRLLNSIAESGKGAQVETMAVLADGPHHFRSDLRPITDTDGETVSIQAVSVDITESKRAEERLRESEARFRAIFEQAAVGVALMETATGRFVRANRKCCDIIGLAPENLATTTFMAITHPEDLQADLENMERLKAGDIREFSMEKRYLRPDGSLVWVALTVSPLWAPGEKPEWHIAVVTDITERKRAEEALRNSEAFLDTIVQRSPYPMWISDENGMLVKLNQALRDLLHITDEDVVGRYNIFQDNMVAEQGLMPLVEQVYREGRQVNFIIHWAAEELKHLPLTEPVSVILDVTISPVVDTEGRVTNAIIQHKDITDFERTAQALRLTQFCFDRASVGIFRFGADARILSVNDQACQDLGYTCEELCGMSVSDIDSTIDHNAMDELWRTVRECGTCALETTHRRKDGTTFPVAITSNLVEYGGEEFCVSFVRDITEDKRAQQERHEYIRFLETMERIDRAIRGTGDLDEMMSAVLDAVLDVFDCDRAWLLHPCDPEGPSWRVPMERTKPEYPGAYALGVDQPMEPPTAEFLRATLASGEPTRFDPESRYAVPPNLAEKFSIEAMLAVAVYPKEDSPWLFGIHQCSHSRSWTDEELRLLREIGRRITDSLRLLLAVRDLRESEERFRTVIEQAADSFWLFTTDGKIIDVNQRACDSLGYTREELSSMTIADIDVEVESHRHKERYWDKAVPGNMETLEGVHRRKDGTTFPVEVSVGVIEIAGGRLLVGFSRDISERKRTEDWLADQRKRLLSVFDTLPDFVHVVDLNRSIRFSNHSFRKLFGDPVNHPCHEIIRGASRPCEPCLVQAVLATGEPQQGEWTSHDGRTYMIHDVPFTDVDGSKAVLEIGADITALRQADEQRRATEQKYRALFESTAALVSVYDEGGNCLIMNGVVAGLHGGQPDDFVGRSICELHPAMGEEYLRRIRDVIRSGATREYDDLVRFAGGVRWLLTSLQPVRNTSGQVFAAQVLSQDITARKAAEDALLSAERNYREIFNASHDAMVVHDMDTGAITDVNDRACEMFGYTRDELLAMGDVGRLSQGAPPYSREDAAQWIRKAVEEGPQLFEWHARRKDGELFWIEVLLKHVTLGDQDRILAVDRDITERKHVEEALRQERDFSTTLIQGSSAFFVAISPDGRTLMMNQAMLDSLGYTGDEVAGSDYAETFVPEADRPAVASVWEYLCGEHEPTVSRNRVLAKDGREFLVEWRGRPVLTEHGELDFFFGVGIDITERVRAEEVAAVAQQRLLEHQRDETERVRIELDRLRAQLVNQTRLATVGQVAASIAHELRNPLGAVRNAAYYLKRHTSGLDPKFPEYLSIIDQEIGAADRVIRDMMEMARAKDPIKHGVDLGDLVRGLRERICPPEIRCHIAMDPEPFEVIADGDQMRQVIGNLLTNAIQVMDASGEVGVEAHHGPQHDTIIVWDTGPGVALEHGDRVFEPLFTTKAKGTGLGLTICRQIIERHGGTIELADRPGGCAFRIHLPR